jgi:hypothetical protein
MDTLSNVLCEINLAIISIIMGSEAALITQVIIHLAQEQLFEVCV